MAKITQEQLMAAKGAKSPQELAGMAKKAGVELTVEQADHYFKSIVELGDKLTTRGSKELKEEELENVSGGFCDHSSKACGTSPSTICWGVLFGIDSCKHYIETSDPSSKATAYTYPVLCYCGKGYFSGFYLNKVVDHP